MAAKTCALVERLETISDPRRQGENLKHRLVDIIVLGFCGVLAGCDDFVEMAEWAKVNEAFFRVFSIITGAFAFYSALVLWRTFRVFPRPSFCKSRSMSRAIRLLRCS